MELRWIGTPNIQRWWNVTLILLAGLAISACGVSKSDLPNGESQKEFGQVVPVDSDGTYTDIIPQELATMLEDKDFLFVNVHVPYDGELPDTDAFIPFDKIPDFINDLPEDKNSKVVVYCRSGSMSSVAAQDLVRMGYTNVYNLDGGFRAWSAAGFEFIAP